jgi:addiction module RelE/StbE family toxin
MRELVLTPKFKRTYGKIVRKDKAFQKRLEDILIQMGQDVFANSLGTHKLSGELTGLWACSCGYDCRIVFALETDKDTGQEIILLIDIGTHDEVY